MEVTITELIRELERRIGQLTTVRLRQCLQDPPDSDKYVLVFYVDTCCGVGWYSPGDDDWTFKFASRTNEILEYHWCEIPIREVRPEEDE